MDYKSAKSTERERPSEFGLNSEKSEIMNSTHKSSDDGFSENHQSDTGIVSGCDTERQTLDIGRDSDYEMLAELSLDQHGFNGDMGEMPEGFECHQLSGGFGNSNHQFFGPTGYVTDDSHLFYRIKKSHESITMAYKQVSDNGLKLKNLAERFKDNHLIILASLRQNPNAYESIGKKLALDENLMGLALLSSSLILDYIDDDLKRDEVYMTTMSLMVGDHVLKSLPQSDFDKIKFNVDKFNSLPAISLLELDSRFSENLLFCLFVLIKNPDEIENVSQGLFTDKLFVSLILMTTQIRPDIIFERAEELIQDEDFMSFAVLINQQVKACIKDTSSELIVEKKSELLKLKINKFEDQLKLSEEDFNKSTESEKLQMDESLDGLQVDEFYLILNQTVCDLYEKISARFE